MLEPLVLKNFILAKALRVSQNLKSTTLSFVTLADRETFCLSDEG